MQGFLSEILLKSAIFIALAVIFSALFSMIQNILMARLELKYLNKKSVLGQIFLPFSEFKEIANKDIRVPAKNKILFVLIPPLFLLNSLIMFTLLPISNNLVIFNTGYNLYCFLALIFLQIIIIFLTILVNGSTAKTFIITNKVNVIICCLFVYLVSFICISVATSSGNIQKIVEAQNTVWLFIPLFPVFIIMLTTSVFFVKELYYSTQFNINYDSGYSGILLLMLKIGKYLGILTISGIIASLFLGGYSEFGNEGLQVLTFFVKTFIIAIIILLGLNLTLNLKLETIINVLFKIILPILVIWLLVVSFAVFYR